jgi:hypothetical protein
MLSPHSPPDRTAAGEDDHADDIVYPSTVPFLLVHLACFGALWPGLTAEALVLCGTLYALRMFAIGAGYHRYFAHRAYKTSRVVQFLLAFLAAFDPGDRVISMSILRHFDATPAERTEYLKRRRLMRGEPDEPLELEAEGGELPEARYAEMSAAEQFVLTVSENGFGKRTSSFEYRITGRGGKGIVAMIVNERNGRLVASFPVEDADQIMLVTNRGQLIRVPVDGIRIAGRSTQGVIVFNTAEDERVVSVGRVTGEDANGNGNGEPGSEAAGGTG